jgi:hypothetical protein
VVVVLDREVVRSARVAGECLEGFEAIDRGLDTRQPARHFLRAILIVPEGGLGTLLAQLRELVTRS